MPVHMLLLDGTTQNFLKKKKAAEAQLCISIALGRAVPLLFRSIQNVKALIQIRLALDRMRDIPAEGDLSDVV
jgi:hypothetical protein